jgi:hypothetical protein
MIILLIGVPCNPELKSPESETATLDKWILKTGNPLYKYGKQSSSFDPTSQTEDIGKQLDEGEFLRSEKLAYVAAHLSEWTSDKSIIMKI